jgi:hypothetical protein
MWMNESKRGFLVGPTAAQALTGTEGSSGTGHAILGLLQNGWYRLIGR